MEINWTAVAAVAAAVTALTRIVEVRRKKEGTPERNASTTEPKRTARLIGLTPPEDRTVYPSQRDLLFLRLDGPLTFEVTDADLAARSPSEVTLASFSDMVGQAKGQLELMQLLDAYHNKTFEVSGAISNVRIHDDFISVDIEIQDHKNINVTVFFSTTDVALFNYVQRNNDYAMTVSAVLFPIGIPPASYSFFLYKPIVTYLGPLDPKR